MKLVEIKQLKESDLFKKIIAELNIKGLDKIYLPTNKIDYFDIIIEITNFLELNKKVFKKLNKDNYENLFLIVLVELLENIDSEIDEVQLEKIMVLLKNSLLVQKATNFLIKNLKVLYKKISKNIGYFCCSKKSNVTATTINTEIKSIEGTNFT